MTTRRLSVSSPRNSVCPSCRLSKLYWARWFTDACQWDNALYLHVAGPDDSWHRVWCRKTNSPRLRMDGGKLWWLVDTKGRK